MFLCGDCFSYFQAGTKKSGPSKSTAAKKADGSQSKASAAPEIEDVEVIFLPESILFLVVISLV